MIRTVIAIMLISSCGFAQPGIEWEQVYQHGEGHFFRDLMETDDGGYMLVGTSTNNEYPFNKNAFIIKTDENGEEEWLREYGEDNFSYLPRRIIESNDGNYFIVGSKADEYGVNSPKEYSLLLKINPDGEVIWENLYLINRTNLTMDIVLENDRILMVGMTFTDDGYTDAFLLCTRLNGDSLWAQTYGGDSGDDFVTLIPNGDNYFLVGNSASYEGRGVESNIYIVNVTEDDGEVIWYNTIGTEFDEYVFYAIQGGNGDIVVVGTKDERHPYALVARIDSDGNEIWTTLVGTDEDYYDGWYIANTAHNSFVITGNTYQNLLLARLDSDGDIIWSTELEGNTDLGMVVKSLDNGKYIIGGVGNNRIGLIKTEADPAVVSLDNPAYPSAFNLNSIYPNPFNSNITISYLSLANDKVTLTLYDSRGRTVDKLIDRVVSPGEQTLIWDAGDISGGSYFVVGESGGVRLSKQVVLVR